VSLPTLADSNPPLDSLFEQKDTFDVCVFLVRGRVVNGKHFSQLEPAQAYCYNHVGCGGVVRSKDGMYEVRAAGGDVTFSTKGELCWMKMHTPSNANGAKPPEEGRNPRNRRQSPRTKPKEFRNPEATPSF
jgi:hypothetical protein